MGKIKLECLECGKEYLESRIVCDNGCDSLLRSIYDVKEFRPTAEKNIFKFLDWLPCSGKVETSIGPVVYKSEKFAAELGLENLYVAFNGYWPERGAGNITGSFKDYEALPTLLNFREHGRSRIILSSAGNTARAFAYAATVMDFDTYIVLPGNMLNRLWIPTDLNLERIHVIAVKDSCDYYQAINLAADISRECDIPSEAGARNVARRDGMGTVMLEAARVMGRLPAQYFQAVGSGTGSIAAYEASLRLVQDPRFRGQHPPKLNLAQNSPFTPIYHAWEENTPIKPEHEIHRQLEQISEMHADVLANRKPPYHTRGGVEDVLKSTCGTVHKITNRQAVDASHLFQNSEGIDILPAASVCAAALIKAVEEGKVKPNEDILLNITGGGLHRIKQDFHCHVLEPELVVEPGAHVNWKELLN